MQEERQKAKEDALELKQRQKMEAAEEKQRLKKEAEQERKLQADTANIVKNALKIKIKIGGGGTGGGGGGGAGGISASGPTTSDHSNYYAAPLRPAPAALNMGTSNMFFSSTDPSGSTAPKKKKAPLGGALGHRPPGRFGDHRPSLKPKIKIGGASGTLRASKPSPALDAPLGVAPPLAPELDMVSLPDPSQWAAEPLVAAGGPVPKVALEKMLNRIQAKDVKKIFLHPVTDAIVRG